MITSPRNPAVAEVVKLHRARTRRAAGRTVLEGPNLLAAAAAAGADVTAVFALDDDAATADLCSRTGLGLRLVTPEVLERMAPSVHPRGPVALLTIPDPAPLAATDTVVMLGVSDPGNVGTLIRSAAAFGFAVAVGAATADPWSPKVLRAGAGAHFDVAISELGSDPLAELRAHGLAVAAAVARGGDPTLPPPERPVAVLIGSEPAGLPLDVVDAADVRVTVPTRAIESLNAAVAGSILMHEHAGRRRSRNARP